MFPLRILRILSLEHILATAYEKKHTEHIKSQICLFSRKIAGCVSDDIFRWVMFSFQLNIVGNKAKGRISKRVFQENKAHQIFRKTKFLTTRKHTTPNFPKNELFLINVCFSENLVCFVFLKRPFWDSPFGLITDDITKFIKELPLVFIFQYVPEFQTTFCKCYSDSFVAIYLHILWVLSTKLYYQNSNLLKCSIFHKNRQCY